MIDRVLRSQELHDAFFRKTYLKGEQEYIAFVSHTFVVIELIPDIKNYYESYNHNPKPCKYYVEGDAETIKSKLLEMGFILKA